MYDYNDTTLKLICRYAEGKNRAIKMPKDDAIRFKNWIENESPELTLEIRPSKSSSMHSLVKIIEK